MEPTLTHILAAWAVPQGLADRLAESLGAGTLIGALLLLIAFAVAWIETRPRRPRRR